MSGRQSSNVFFGSFEFNLTSGELQEGERTVRLHEQPFQILKMLVQDAGEVVTREQIRKRLWPNNTIVEFDHSINAAIKKLRFALGDSASEPRYVETVARRGYRFIAPVQFTRIQLAREANTAVHSGTHPPAPAQAGLIGRKVSHYRVLEILGGGGMGVVYKAEDLTLGRRVALKFLPEELTSDPIALERFRREARAASALNHPNVCTIHEIQEHAGQAFIAMELLEGSTLRDLIGENSVPVYQQLDIGVQVGGGLEAAHEMGIIHRDIKPGNIFVTSRGEAKILDFGVAILTNAGKHRAEVAPDYAVANDPARPVNLTRTGVRTGTASYMSPEQVRGDKLDGRTDLFSFGLVLYELATGRQAFSEATAEELQNAILNRSPAPARELNHELPQVMENIIDMALRKDRSARYQTASEMRADLQAAVRTLSQPVQDRAAGSRRKAAVALLAAVVLLSSIFGALFWMKRDVSPIPELKQWQLTANPDDNPVHDGQISPDGKSLAYCDLNGMHVQVIATGDVQRISEPGAFKDGRSYYSGLGWFPDSKRLYANVSVPGRRDSIWTLSLAGGTLRKLHDDADASSISPDGSAIVFSRRATRFGDGELWLMGPDGDQVRKLCEVGDDSGFTMTAWSPDGRRLACIRNHQALGKLETVLEVRDLKGGPPSTLLADTRLRNVCWLPDARVIYSLADSDINGLSSNYWELKIDPRTGDRVGTPRRLTNWTAFATDRTKATADGKRLAFKRWRLQRSVQIADLEWNSTRMTPPRRLTNRDANEFPMAWTADSKAVLFLSNRTGRWAILKQLLNSETPEAVVKRTEDMAVTVRNFELPDPVDPSSISPDGAWVLYLAYAKEDSSSTPLRLLRAPITGGSPEIVLTGMINGQRCGKIAGAPCAFAERSRDYRELIFSSFDPVKGRRGELMRFATDPNAEYEWDLSPDGTRIAVHKRREAKIEVLSSIGEAAREIPVNGWSRFDALHWAADGKGFFGCSRRQTNSVLLHVDLQGSAQVLWEQAGSPGNDAAGIWGIPSRDGRHLALMHFTLSSNIWMMEGF